jgi:hypothetical protein
MSGLLPPDDELVNGAHARNRKTEARRSDAPIWLHPPQNAMQASEISASAMRSGPDRQGPVLTEYTAAPKILSTAQTMGSRRISHGLSGGFCAGGRRHQNASAADRQYPARQ